MLRARSIPAALAVLVILSGCGLDRTANDRVNGSIGRFGESIAAGQTGATCRLLTPAGRRELEQAFQAPSCARAAAGASAVVRRSPGQGRFFRRVRPLEFAITPSGTSLLTSGADFARIRVAFFDPVVGASQAVDLEVRKLGGAWRLGEGVAALVPNVPPSRKKASAKAKRTSKRQHSALLRVDRHRVGRRYLTTAEIPPTSPTDPRTARFTFKPLLFASAVAIVLLLGGLIYMRRRPSAHP